MESQTDQVVFEKSVDQTQDVPLFQDKNYTYITDSTSNSGTFTSGQIQFDLSTFSSQSQWINLSKAVVQIPYKITGELLTPASGTGTSKKTQFGYLASTFKNGFHHIIDSAQLVINGQTIQSAQPYENISASFKIYSTFSQDTMQKWGPTLGLAMDDCTGNTMVNITSTNNANESLWTYHGLTNSQPTDLLDNVKGYDVCSEKAQNKALNLGLAKRFRTINNSKGNTLANHILGPNLESSGMSNVGANSGTDGTGFNVADKYFSLFALCTIRLKDICSIENFPLTKNLKGYLYLSFNSFKVNLTGPITETPAYGIASVSYTPMNGRTCPFIIMDSISGDNQAGLILGGGTSAGASVSFTGTVDGTSTGAVGTSKPISSNARLLCPYYIANPKVDEALTMTKTFSSYEKVINPIIVAKGQTISYTISVGIPNPRKLVLVPFYQNLSPLINDIANSRNGEPIVTNLSNPEHSAFDTVPATSSAFGYLKNLQVYLANKPIYQYPMEYGFEQWIAENSHLGLNGNADDELTSGLLSQQLWEQNHRFYAVDLSCRI